MSKMAMVLRRLIEVGGVVTSVLLLLLLDCGAASQVPVPLVSRIAFGSCANQSAPQPIWNAIIDFDPQIFIWLGDNIYGDIRRPLKLFGKERTIGPWKNVPRFIPSSEHEMQARYDKAKRNDGYNHLRENVKVIGTWDDHDYGLNDAGKEFDGKITNQRLMLDFLDEPQDSPRRKQAGVYASYTFGPAGRQVKVILLDTRYHRDPLFSDGSILGNSQWTWLEKELNGPASAITIIGSSIQSPMLAHWTSGFPCWGDGLCERLDALYSRGNPVGACHGPVTQVRELEIRNDIG
ncbi:hypothetical protein CsSME_00036510 [Camellia sinensis var. sinensis]